MTDLEKAARQALEALEVFATSYSDGNAAITALRRALEQPAQQEPVAWMDECRISLVTAIHFLASDYENALGVFRDDTEARRKAEGDIAYARKIAAKWNWNGASPPAQRTWVGLTDEAKAVINAARAAMDASTEADDGEGSITISSELAASLSLCLDEYDRAIEAAHGIGEKK
jgi:hypothetical protein